VKKAVETDDVMKEAAVIKHNITFNLSANYVLRMCVFVCLRLRVVPTMRSFEFGFIVAIETFSA
jgi:hypothetical protein